MRGAIAGDDAVVDHLEVGRRHGHDDCVDGRRRDATRDDVLERLRRRHGLPRRAPRLERDLGQGGALAEAVGERGDGGRDAEDVGKDAAFEQLAVGGEALLRCQRRVEAVAGGIAHGEPARGGCRIVMSHGGRRQRERQRQRVRARLLVELEEPRGDGGHAEGRGEIGRPDAAIEDSRPVDGAAEPSHGLGAGEDRRDHVVGRDRRQRARERERAGNDDRAGRDHGGEMDVVDLAQPRERAAGREIERPCALSTRAHRGAKLQQAQAFDGARARDQGADGVDEVELDELPRGVGGAFACSDMASEPFEGGHVATTRVS